MMFSNTAQYSRTTLGSDIRLATKPAVFVVHVWGERTEGEIARQGLPNDKIWICEENTSLLKETLISQWAGSNSTIKNICTVALFQQLGFILLYI